MCVEYVLKEIRSCNQVFFACQSIYFIDIYTLFVTEYITPQQNTDTFYLIQNTHHYDINKKTKQRTQENQRNYNSTAKIRTLLICFMDLLYFFQNFFALFFEH